MAALVYRAPTPPPTNKCTNIDTEGTGVQNDVHCRWVGSGVGMCTVEPRYNEPLYKEVLAITNDFL